MHVPPQVPAPVSPAPDRPDDLRASLRRVIVAWVFGAAWMNVVNGAALTRYAQSLHLSPFGFGLLSAAPFVGPLAQLPSGYITERFNCYKPFMISVGLAHRLLWAVIALVPWTVPLEAQPRVFLGLVVLSSLLGNAIYPAWMSWMSWLVPRRVRGHYLGRRVQFGQFSSLFATVAAGYLLDWGAQRGAHVMTLTLSLLLGCAAIVGAIDFLFFLPVPPPVFRHTARPSSLWTMIRQPLVDRNFRRFLGFSAMMAFSSGYLSQFVWLYVFNVAGFSNVKANGLLMVVPIAVTMVMYPVWGRIIDRIGRKPVLLIATTLVVHGAIVWSFITPEHWVVGVVTAVVAMMAWPGVDVASFNMLLGMGEGSGGRRFGTAFVALNSLVVAVAGMTSGLFGGAVAEALGDGWRGSLLGWPITYHGVLFVMTAVLRLAALLWVVRLEDRRAYATRDALEYVGQTFYNDFRQMAVLPYRVLVQVGRWTYKLVPRGW